MKKREDLAVFNSHLTPMDASELDIHAKEEIERTIRIMADKDKEFENRVFGLGCSVLAITYLEDINDIDEFIELYCKSIPPKGGS